MPFSQRGRFRPFVIRRIGNEEIWSYNTALHEESYVEIQAGQIKDQSIKDDLHPGDKKVYCEYWIPTTKALNLSEIELPKPNLIPTPPRLHLNEWPPSGMTELENAIRWAVAIELEAEKDVWECHLGIWYAGNDQFDYALEVLLAVTIDFARLVEARIYLNVKKQPGECVKALSRIGDLALALHPQVVIERDIALERLGKETIEERAIWLDKLGALKDVAIIERRCQLLFDQGKFQEAKEMLESTNFSLVHQRYFRTNLWMRINEKLRVDLDKSFLESLGEDQLAKFGQYRVYDSE